MFNTLLEETLTVLEKNGKTADDVLWCGSENFGYFPFSDFCILSNFKYDRGFGSPQIAQDLLVVGHDFWLERHEYDGSEWWEYKSMPKKPCKQASPVALSIEQAIDRGFDVSCGWENLLTINGYAERGNE